VINAVRFASAFFGKGQFVPARSEKREGSWHLEQSMDAPYWQPLDPPRKVGTEDWFAVRRERRQTEVCQMNYSADIVETTQGFRLRIQASGTRGVPLAVEINMRGDGKLEGCEPAPQVSDAWVLAKGHALYRAGANAIRFGPGSAPHRYTQIRGARPKLPGPSVYITGYTPFDQTIEFECS
jgi:hypothetical protein